MGCFDFTCCISGLPIHAGDEVRYLLLTENPFFFRTEEPGGINNEWVPRTFPLRAKYNDYGGVSDLQKGPAQDIWLDGLRLDLIELGPGDTPFHEREVRRDMPLDQILEVIPQGHVQVYPYSHYGKQKTKIQSGIPTIKRVRHTLSELGLSTKDFQNGFLVSLQSRGFVRVRWQGPDEVKHLSEAQARLSRFATMITTATGNTTRKAELIVAPKPGPNYRITFNRKTPRRSHLDSTMIRQDVWQAITSLKFKSCNKDCPETCQGWRDLAKDHWTLCQKHGDSEVLKSLMLGCSCSSSRLFLGEFPSVRSLRNHFDLMLQKNPSENELTDFLSAVGEMAFVQYILSHLRYQWRPSRSTGPQFGEWKLHEEFCAKLTKICRGQPEGFLPLDLEAYEEAWSVVVLDPEGYASSVRTFGTRKQAEQLATEEGNCYVVQGTHCWGKTLGHVEEGSKDPPTRYYP